MFGGDMMKKLQEMQAAVATSKERLATIKVTGEAAGGKVTVESDGNRKITQIKINADLSQLDREELEELILIATNNALEKAEKVNEQEMAQNAGKFMPGKS